MSSAENTDYEGDTFEDAPDSSNQPEGAKPTSSTRSLTDRPSSAASDGTPRAAKPPPLPSRTSTEHVTKSDMNGHAESENALEQEIPPKSPLLTSHRLSTSSLDDVNLSGTKDDGESIESHPSTDQTKAEPIPATSKPPPFSSRLQGFSASLPSVPWGPPPSKSSNLPSPQPPSRKLTSPFAWLARNTSAPKETRSPQLNAGSFPTGRRNTAASISTLGSNPELMLNRLDDGHEAEGSGQNTRKPAGNTLRDRFKLLRMREEAGITSLDDPTIKEPGQGGALAGLIGRSASLGLGVGSPTSLADEKEGGLAVSPGATPTTTVPPTGPLSSTVNPNLAPGTVSGVSTAPSDPAAPVDWDLWQSVVYEGPAVVARTSADELARAIAGGIPQPIRGVVWQVLAVSKNEDLEGVYRELVVRGTDNEPNRTSGSSASITANGHLNGSVKEKDSIASSGSSIHSEHSTPATSSNIGVTPPSPSHEKDAESTGKLQSALIAERKQKVKEDAAALQKLEKAIKRDLGSRTSYSKYAAAAGMQEGLFGVCKAYALFDEGVGYAQGMNFLVMPLLFTMPEEEAFCLLVRLMNKYALREMFIQDMPGLHLHLYQFERLLEDLEPALYCHLHRRGVTPQLYATQWFLTLFAYRLPLQLVLRIYDLIFSEGLEGAILKFGIALLQRNTETLLGMKDMVALTNFLKEKLFDVYIDQTPSATSLLESGFFGSSGGSDRDVYRADIMVQDACAVKITPEMLKTYTTEWEEKVRLEKEREAEIESLKSTITSQSSKIRSLEERAEKSDIEHVQIASEMVRMKVINEELQDANDSLKGQVQELKIIVDTQPEELEEKLRTEMDRIMKRNIEVQNENRAMEEQLADMEQDLVATKMKYAEINENHETLKQKWNDLRKALD